MLTDTIRDIFYTLAVILTLKLWLCAGTNISSLLTLQLSLMPYLRITGLIVVDTITALLTTMQRCCTQFGEDLVTVAARVSYSILVPCSSTIGCRHFHAFVHNVPQGAKMTFKKASLPFYTIVIDDADASLYNPSFKMLKSQSFRLYMGMSHRPVWILFHVLH